MARSREICDIHAFDFLNCENTFDFTDVQAAIYDRKTVACRFTTINEILRSLSLAQSLPECANFAHQELRGLKEKDY